MRLKRKHIVEKVSKELNISAYDIDDIVYSYYNHVLKLVNDLEYTHIYINRLCTLDFRLKRTSEYITLLDKVINKRKRDNQLRLVDEMEARNNKLKKLIEKLYQEGEDRKNKREQRYEFINSVEEQRSDFRRNIE